MLTKLQQLLQQKLSVEEQPVIKPIDGLDQKQALSLVLMTEMAFADGSLDDSEREQLTHYLRHDYQLTQAQAETALDQAEQEVKMAASLQHFTAPLKELPYDAKVELIETLWRLAYADTELDPHEESMLRKLADLLYVSHADFIKTKLKVTDNL